MSPIELRKTLYSKIVLCQTWQTKTWWIVDYVMWKNDDVKNKDWTNIEIITRFIFGLLRFDALQPSWSLQLITQPARYLNMKYYQSIIKVLKHLTCPQTGRSRSCWSWRARCRRWCRRCPWRTPWPPPAGPSPCPRRSAWCRRCPGTGRPCQHYFIKAKNENRWLFSICLKFL